MKNGCSFWDLEYYQLFDDCNGNQNVWENIGGNDAQLKYSPIHY